MTGPGDRMTQERQDNTGMVLPIERLEVLTTSYGPFGVQAAAEHAPALGVSGLEVVLRPLDGLVDLPASVAESERGATRAVAGLRQKLAAHGVQATSVAGLQRIMAADGFEAVQVRLNLAQALGATTMTGGADTVLDEALPALYERLLLLADYAGARGVTLALETHPPLAHNATAMLRTMRDLSHRNVRLNFDTANIYFYNQGMTDGAAELARVVEHVAHLHLKDCRGGYRDWYFPALGDGGAVDFARVGRILEAAGFHGRMSIELEGIRGEPELTLEDRRQRLARSVAHLRQVGLIG